MSLGLSEKEAETYIELARLGPSAPSTLAKIVGANRTSMYDILARLEEKGLVIVYRKNKTTFYTVDDLSKLVYREKEQVNVAQNIVKMLADQHSTAGLSVKYYIGVEGLRELYASILESKAKVLYVWANSEEFHKTLEQKFVQEWIKKRVKSGISTKMIQTESAHALEYKSKDKTHNREIRFVPNNALTFTSTCYIFADTIVLFDTQGRTIGLRIDNTEITKMFKQIFDVAWNVAK